MSTVSCPVLWRWARAHPTFRRRRRDQAGKRPHPHPPEVTRQVSAPLNPLAGKGLWGWQGCWGVAETMARATYVQLWEMGINGTYFITTIG